MRRYDALWGYVLVSALTALDARADGANTAPAVDVEPDDHAPFYDAGEGRLPLPPLPKPTHPRSVVVSPTLDVSEVVIPNLTSGGVLVEPMLEVGNDFVSGSVGYANLGGSHGGDLAISILRWASAVRIYRSHGWFGTWLLPDVTARFVFFPGPASPPSWMLGAETRLGGIRFSKCLTGASDQGVCLELTAAAEIGPAAISIGDAEAALVAGGHFEVGFAFWR